MKTYVTFGQDHTHTIGDKVFDKDCVAVVWGDREKVFSIFGDRFCFEYPEEHWDDSKMQHYFKRGYIEADLGQDVLVHQKRRQQIFMQPTFELKQLFDAFVTVANFGAFAVISDAASRPFGEKIVLLMRDESPPQLWDRKRGQLIANLVIDEDIQKECGYPDKIAFNGHTGDIEAYKDGELVAEWCPETGAPINRP